MEINRFNYNNLRNVEYYQFLTVACDIFEKYKVDSENLQSLYDTLKDCLELAEKAMAIEKKNDKIMEKNEVDSYRDKLHSKLFNYINVNGYANISSKKTIYENMINEMNVLVNKYDLLLLTRKNNNQNNQPTTNNNQPNIKH